uniref:[histone H3]-lysine(27) N-trimethyltransferase n=1 Tax=Angiostrongylus cantonensis TaxID=6313 RepID=A0A0K0CXV6_ANGCA
MFFLTIHTLTTGNCRTKQCQCYFARWECDPDLCKSCKCGEYCFVFPYLILLSKGDLIAEYTGEVISKWESERRGLIYDKFCTSYIFAWETPPGRCTRYTSQPDNRDASQPR